MLVNALELDTPAGVPGTDDLAGALGDVAESRMTAGSERMEKRQREH
jgi:hypothetical protein